MPTTVRGASLQVGHVIQDAAYTGDTHPYLVVKADQWTVTLRNCTSHANSSLSLIPIAQADKVGDPVWSGNSSYLVTGGPVTSLAIFSITTVTIVEPVLVPGPMVPVTLLGTHGPYTAYVPSGPIVVPMPRQIQRFTENSYRVVGGVQADRMAAILEELES
jgi:hypothetical protein